MLVFRILPLETLSEQRKSQLCRTCFMTVVKGVYGNNKPLLNKNSLRTIEAQFVPKRKNNEARPKFTGSYKKKRVYSLYLSSFSYFPPLSCIALMAFFNFFLLTFLVFLMSFFPIPRFMAFMLFHLRSHTSRPPTTQKKLRSQTPKPTLNPRLKHQASSSQ